MNKRLLEILFVFFGIIFCLVYFLKNKNYYLPSPPQIKHAGVVSLLPSDTEILFELGVNDIKGVSNYCNYPDAAKKIRKMGDAFSPDTEAIISAAPDVVFAGKGLPNTAAEKLRESGIKIFVVPNPHNINDIFFNINFIASNTGKDSKNLIADLKKISNIATPVKAKVYVDIDGNFWTVGYMSFITDILRRAGLENIFDNIGEEYFQSSWEAVAERNPDIILSLAPDTADFSSLPGAANVNAVKFHRVYKLPDPDLLARPTPRAIRNIPYLKGIADAVK
jgi:iron complex transport system substrate-binding protein